MSSYTNIYSSLELLIQLLMNVICIQHQGNKKELMLIEVDLLNQSPELYESRSIDFERSISSPQ